MSLISYLEKAGLTEKEAKIYLASLELSQSSVQNIAKKASINRATAYVILESLIKKGLCSTYQQEKKTYYVANDPDTLNATLELKKKAIEETQKQFKKILPKLALINNQQKDKPVVKFFDGMQGVLNSAKEILEAKATLKEPLRMVYPVDLLKKIASDEQRNKHKTLRLNKKIKSKVIYSASEIIPSTADGERTRVEKKAFPISADIGIYGDTVRISSLGNRLSSIIIQDQEIANTLKTIFELAWIGANIKDKR